MVLWSNLSSELSWAAGQHKPSNVITINDIGYLDTSQVLISTQNDFYMIKTWLGLPAKKGGGGEAACASQGLYFTYWEHFPGFNKPGIFNIRNY